jgi:hypothetical protein
MTTLNTDSFSYQRKIIGSIIAGIFLSSTLSSCALLGFKEKPYEWCGVEPADKLHLIPAPENEAELLALDNKGNGKRKPNYRYFWFGSESGELSACSIDEEHLQNDYRKKVSDFYVRPYFKKINGVWQITRRKASIMVHEGSSRNYQ